MAVELAGAKVDAKLLNQLAENTAEVGPMKASIQASDQAKQLAVIEATTRVAKERDRLKADLAKVALDGLERLLLTHPVHGPQSTALDVLRRRLRADA